MGRAQGQGRAGACRDPKAHQGAGRPDPRPSPGRDDLRPSSTGPLGGWCPGKSKSSPKRPGAGAEGPGEGLRTGGVEGQGCRRPSRRLRGGPNHPESLHPPHAHQSCSPRTHGHKTDICFNFDLKGQFSAGCLQAVRVLYEALSCFPKCSPQADSQGQSSHMTI